MLGLLLFYLAYCLVVYYGGLLLKTLFESLFYLISVAWEPVIAFLVEALGWLLVTSIRTVKAVLVGTLDALYGVAARLWKAIYLALTFLYFLIDEVIRGPRPEEDDDEYEDEADETAREEKAQAAQNTAYEEAVRLLGLRPGFTKEELTKAYRRAIRAVHPDKGGSTEDAQAVNAARKLIEAHQGWA